MRKNVRSVAGFVLAAQVFLTLLGCVNPPKRSSAVRPAATQTPNNSGGPVPEYPPPNESGNGSGDTREAGGSGNAPTKGGGFVVEYWLNPTSANNCLTIQMAGESAISAPCTGSVTPDSQWVSRKYVAQSDAGVAAQVTVETTDRTGAKITVQSDNLGGNAWRMRCASAPAKDGGGFETVLCYEDGDEATLSGAAGAPSFDSSDLFVRVRGPKVASFGQVECQSVSQINMPTCKGL